MRKIFIPVAFCIFVGILASAADDSSGSDWKRFENQIRPEDTVNYPIHLIQPPKGLVVERWEMHYDDCRSLLWCEEWEECLGPYDSLLNRVRPVNCVIGSDSIYFQGIDSFPSDAWMAGKISDDGKVTFSNVQESEIYYTKHEGLTHFGEDSLIYLIYPEYFSWVTFKAKEDSKSGYESYAKVHTVITDSIQGEMLAEINSSLSIVRPTIDSINGMPCGIVANDSHSGFEIGSLMCWYYADTREPIPDQYGNMHIFDYLNRNQFVNVWFKKCDTGDVGITIPDHDEVSAPVFNLQGIRVNPDHLPPGIYIRNGKKFSIR